MVLKCSILLSSAYPQPTDDGSPPWKDRSLVLRCQESGQHDDRRSQFIWMDSSGPLTSSDQYTINGPQLTITNASAVSDNTIRCSEILRNGITVTGAVYRVEPLSEFARKREIRTYCIRIPCILLVLVNVQ